jgi:membrane-bound ClpP family serine protease
MGYKKRKRSFMLVNLVTTTAEEAVLVTVLLVIIPLLGINIPIWLIVVFVLAWAAWSGLIYRLAIKTSQKIPVVGPETMVGTSCITTTALSPIGYVKVGSELWQARSTQGDINSEAEVVIVEVKNLTLLVTPSPKITKGNVPNPSSKPAVNGQGQK